LLELFYLLLPEPAYGAVEFQRGNLKEAVSIYSQVAEVAPAGGSQEEALYWLGVSHYKNGNKDSLMKAWNTLLDKYPASLWAGG
jgi:outer membrane protein assembly factor BamD (BamD/ComL family)